MRNRDNQSQHSLARGLKGSGAKLEFLILHHIRLAPFRFCFVFTKTSKSRWSRPPAWRLSVTLCQLLATQMPDICGMQDAGIVPGKCAPDPAGEGICGFVGASGAGLPGCEEGHFVECHSASRLGCSLTNSGGSCLSSTLVRT